MLPDRTMDFMRDERGGPLVEMAVLLLPFLLIVAIVIEGGNLFWRHQISLKAVRDTARYVSRAPLLFDEDCALDGAVLATTTTFGKLLGVTGSLDGGPPLVPGWTTADIDIPTPIVLRAGSMPRSRTGGCRCRAAAPVRSGPAARRADPGRHDHL